MKHRTSILRLCFTVIVPSTSLLAGAPSTPPDSLPAPPPDCAHLRQLISPVFPRTLVEGPILRGFQFAGSTAMLRGSTTEHTVAVSALLGPTEREWNASIYGAFRDRKPHDLDGDAFSDITSLRSNVVGFTGNAHPGALGVFTLDASMARIDSRGGNSFHLPAHETDATEERNQRVLTGAVRWQRESATGTFSAEATIFRQYCNEYFGTERDPNAYGMHHVEGQTIETGFTTPGYPAFAATAETHTAIQYTHEILHDEVPGYDRQWFEDRSRLRATLGQRFAWEQFSAEGGISIIGHQRIEGMLALPFAELQWRPHPATVIRGLVETSYEAPGLRECDVQMEPVSGAVLLIAPVGGLPPERSTATAIGATLAIPAVYGGVEIMAFHKRRARTFFLRQTHSPDERYLTAERINGGDASTHGVTLGLDARVTHHILIEAAITVQRASFDAPQDWGGAAITDRPFFTPEVFGEAAVTAQIVHGFRVQCSARYTGPMALPHYTPNLAQNHTETAPAFVDLGMMLSYDISEEPCVALIAGVSNLLNHYQPWLDPDSDPTEALSQGPTRPRAYFVGLRVTL